MSPVPEGHRDLHQRGGGDRNRLRCNDEIEGPDRRTPRHSSRHGGSSSDEETEAICRDLGYRADPAAIRALRSRARLDSKLLETTRLGNQAGAPSVPSILGTPTDYATLVSMSEAGPGSAPTRRSSSCPMATRAKTAFLVADESDWTKHAINLANRESKIMKRIRNTALAVEAVITRHGTIVGPFMVDLTGYTELTPYKGGWCGNDMFPDAMTTKQRAAATTLGRRLGDRLAQEGYQGFFEVDVLIDLDTDEVLPRPAQPPASPLPPRSPMSPPARTPTLPAALPLPSAPSTWTSTMGLPDVDEINERGSEPGGGHRHAEPAHHEAATSPPGRAHRRCPRGPGRGRVLPGRLAPAPSAVLGLARPPGPERAPPFMRDYGAGDYLFKGADLGHRRDQGGGCRPDDPKALTDRCRSIIAGLRSAARHVVGCGGPSGSSDDPSEPQRSDLPRPGADRPVGAFEPAQPLRAAGARLGAGLAPPRPSRAEIALVQAEPLGGVLAAHREQLAAP
ncbi:MAG: hypothetical protein V9G19_18345 [Tetrasphaera sp.]